MSHPGDYINGHNLYRSEGLGDPVKCPNLEIWEDMKPRIIEAGADPDDIAYQPYWHDEHCYACHGTDVYRWRVTVAYSCGGCYMESDVDKQIFKDTCCLGWANEIYTRRTQHEDYHELDNLDVRDCPVCIEKRQKAGRSGALAR